MNGVAILFHYLDFNTGQNGTKGIFLDFVGQGKLKCSDEALTS